MAAMGRDLNGEYRLFVYWLENSVTVTGVELYLGKTNSTLVIPISAHEREQNMKARHLSVVRAVSWKWEVSEGVWHNLDQITHVSDIRIRLLRSNKAISDWHPPVFYKLDRWMGSKQITEIRN